MPEPTPICERCLLPHPFPKRPGVEWIAENCVVAQAETMKRLIDQIGRQATCDGCDRVIFWITHRNGKATPYTSQGLNHFIDCPARDRFKRPRA